MELSNKKLTKKGLENVVGYLKRQIKNANNIGCKDIYINAIKKDVNNCINWSEKEAYRIILSNKEFLKLTTVYDKTTLKNSIKGLQTYTKIIVKSFDNSTNKNRKKIVTLYKVGTRNDLFNYAKNYIVTNNIKLNDVIYEVI